MQQFNQIDRFQELKVKYTNCDLCNDTKEVYLSAHVEGGEIRDEYTMACLCTKENK